MNELDVLRRLASAARRENPPLIDVSGRVLRAIAVRPERVSRVFFAFAGACSAAAMVVFFLALRAWAAWQDPVNDLVGSFSMVMQ